MAVLSEGRGLRVRKYGPDASRGMSSRPTSWREAGGEIVAMLALCPPYGRAQPAPRRGGPSQARWRGGERFGDRRFSRRDALCASAWQGPTNAEAFHFHPTMRQKAGWPTGHMSRSSASPPCGRAEPAPPRGASLGERPWGVNPGITRRVLFSEGRTLCVRMARP